MKKENGYYLNRHSCFLLQYHLVLVTKYRHKIIMNNLKNALILYTKKYFEERELNILQIHTDADYIHIMFEAYPNLNLATFINAYKSASSRRMRIDFAEFLKPYYWKPYFWSKSYFIATISDKSINIVQNYIKNQNEE